MSSYDEYHLFEKAAQEALSGYEKQKLERYVESHQSELCRMCDTCKRHCTKGVEISSVIRAYDYYLKQEQDIEKALFTYQNVPIACRGDANCSTCRLCESVCPNGIPITDKLKEAQIRLSGFIA